MARVLLLIFSAFIGTATAQLRLDSVGRPPFDTVNVPVQRQSVFSVQTVDQPVVPSVASGGFMPPQIPVRPVAVDQPRQSLPSVMPPQSMPTQIPPQQRIGVEALPTLTLQRQVQPMLGKAAAVAINPFNGIINKDRILTEGFQQIERRFTTTRKRRSMLLLKRKLSNRMRRDENSDNGGKFSADLASFYPSSTSLQPESAYDESATLLVSSRLSSRSGLLSNQITSQIDAAEPDQEIDFPASVNEGSGKEPRTEDEIDLGIFGYMSIPRGHPPVENSVVEDSDSGEFLPVTENSFADVENDFPSEWNPTPVTPPVTPPSSINPNSVPLFRDSKLVRIVKEYAGLIVGIILGIPATVVLCYFIYLKRLKRYTGTLDVSPRHSTLPKTSRMTVCSEENELACSPSASASKSPHPPPFPSQCKKHSS